MYEIDNRDRAVVLAKDGAAILPYVAGRQDFA